jgi:hypothetical protein
VTVTCRLPRSPHTRRTTAPSPRSQVRRSHHTVLPYTLTPHSVAVHTHSTQCCRTHTVGSSTQTILALGFTLTLPPPAPTAIPFPSLVYTSPVQSPPPIPTSPPPPPPPPAPPPPPVAPPRSHRCAPPGERTPLSGIGAVGAHVGVWGSEPGPAPLSMPPPVSGGPFSGPATNAFAHHSAPPGMGPPPFFPGAQPLVSARCHDHTVPLTGPSTKCTAVCTAHCPTLGS